MEEVEYTWEYEEFFEDDLLPEEFYGIVNVNGSW